MHTPAPPSLLPAALRARTHACAGLADPHHLPAHVLCPAAASAGQPEAEEEESEGGSDEEDASKAALLERARALMAVAAERPLEEREEQELYNTEILLAEAANDATDSASAGEVHTMPHALIAWAWGTPAC